VGTETDEHAFGEVQRRSDGVYGKPFVYAVGRNPMLRGFFEQCLPIRPYFVLCGHLFPELPRRSEKKKIRRTPRCALAVSMFAPSASEVPSKTCDV
jgi:hypothetical protein